MDWNSDGRGDLVTGEEDGHIRIYLNVGTAEAPSFGSYSYLRVAGSAFQCSEMSMPDVVDWNNDGKKDVLCGDYDGNVYLLINTGTDSSPAFAAASFVQAGGGNLNVGYYASPAVADWNQDGKKDLLVGDYYGEVRYFENVGTDAVPVFGSGQLLQAGGSTIEVGYYSRLDVADWNNDGLPDILVGDGAGYVTLFVQVAVPDQSDLSLTNLVVSPSTVTTKAFTACSFDLVNNGPAALSSESVTVDYYLSDDMTFGDADDYKIGDTGFTVSIAAAATYSINLSSTDLANMVRMWPEGKPDGNYYVFAKATLTNSPPIDPVGSNNYDRTDSTITVDLVPDSDLSLTNLVVSPSTVTTKAFTACSFDLVNNGPAALSLESVMVDYYLSDDTTFGDADDYKIGDTGFTVSIAPAATYSIDLSSTDLANMVRMWPGGKPDGSCYVFAKATLTNPPPIDAVSSNNYDRTDVTITVDLYWHVGTITGPAGQLVDVYDCDETADIALSDIAVKFGSAGSVSSISLSGTRAMSGLGVVIDGASSVGSFKDGRKGAKGDVAFIVSNAPIKSIQLKSGMTGYDLEGLTLGGLSLPADIDGDGDTADETAIYAKGSVGTIALAGKATGDVWIGGKDSKGLALSSFSNKAGGYYGHLTAAGNVGKISLTGDLFGNVDVLGNLSSFSVKGTSANTGWLRAGSNVQVHGLLGKASATNHETDNGTVPFGIFAASFGSVKVGDHRTLPVEEGDFCIYYLDLDDQLGEAHPLSVGGTVTGYSVTPGKDVDMFSFSVSAGQSVGFDIDRPSGSLNSWIRLFDASGTQLAYNDDGAAPGESSSLESYLEYAFTSAGTYYLGVSGYSNSSYDAVTGGGDVSGSTGVYTLILTDL